MKPIRTKHFFPRIAPAKFSRRQSGAWKTHLIVSCFLFAAASLANGQKPFAQDPNDLDEFNCAVSGRVVDDQNHPVADARIVLDDQHQVFFFASEADGTFLLESHCGPDPTQRILFIASGLDIGAIDPISPPDYRNLELGPAFGGQPVVLTSNQELELGDIRVQTYYSKVTIEVRAASGKPFFNPRTNWGRVWLRVRDGRGRVVAETSISDANSEELKGPSSKIPMYLPEGNWRIEFNLDEDRGPWFSSTGLVEVSRSRPVSETVVTVAQIMGEGSGR